MLSAEAHLLQIHPGIWQTLSAGQCQHTHWIVPSQSDASCQHRYLLQKYQQFFNKMLHRKNVFKVY